MAANAPGLVERPSEPSVEVFRGATHSNPDLPLVINVGIGRKGAPFVEIILGDKDSVQGDERFKIFQEPLRPVSWERRESYDGNFEQGRIGNRSGSYCTGARSFSLAHQELVALTIQTHQAEIQAVLEEHDRMFDINDLDRLQSFINRTFGAKLYVVARGM